MEKDPTIVTLAETLLEENEKVEMRGYTVVERTNLDKENRGTAIAIKNELLTVTKEVGTYNEIGEQTWIDIDNTKIKARIGVVYAPQESKTPKSEMKKFYDEIQKKVQQAKEQEKNIILTGDLNAKIGENIKGNNQQITKGGRLLLKLANSRINNRECKKLLQRKVDNNRKRGKISY